MPEIPSGLGYLDALSENEKYLTNKYALESQQQTADAFKASLPSIIASMGPGGLQALGGGAPGMNPPGMGAPPGGAPGMPPQPQGPFRPPGFGPVDNSNAISSRFGGLPTAPAALPPAALLGMPQGGPPGGQGGPAPPPGAPPMPGPGGQMPPPGGPPMAPPGGGGPPPGQQGPQPTLDWRTILQKTMQANPNASGAAILGAVNAWVPLMNSQSQQEWKAVEMQFKQEELQNQRRRLDLESDRNRALYGGPGGFQLNEDDERQAQAIAEGRAAPLPQGFRNPRNRAIMNRVYEINPDFNEANWWSNRAGATATGRAGAMTEPAQGGGGSTMESRVKTEDEFTRGTAAKTTQSFNAVTQHLAMLRDVSKALGNPKDAPRIINAIKQRYAEEMGSAPPTTFNAVRDIVADELVKAITGGAGAVFDRDEIRERLNRANSPAQLQEAIDHYIGLATGQLKALETRYKGGSGRDDYKTRYLAPETRKLLESGTGIGGGGDQAFDREAARKAGYSDKEIDDYLKAQGQQ